MHYWLMISKSLEWFKLFNIISGTISLMALYMFFLPIIVLTVFVIIEFISSVISKKSVNILFGVIVLVPLCFR